MTSCQKINLVFFNFKNRKPIKSNTKAMIGESSSPQKLGREQMLHDNPGIFARRKTTNSYMFDNVKK